MSHLIYKHTNLVNGKIYIGQTSKTMEERWKQHLASKTFTKFSKALRKYGPDNWNHEILEYNIATQELADEKEIYWIKKFNSFSNLGYNLTNGGPPIKDNICEWANHKVYKIDLKHYKDEYNEGNYCRKCRELARRCKNSINKDNELENSYGFDSSKYKSESLNILADALMLGGLNIEDDNYNFDYLFDGSCDNK